MKSLEFEEKVTISSPHRCSLCGNIMPAGSEMVQQEYSCWINTGLDIKPERAEHPTEYQYACPDCHRFADDVERIQKASVHMTGNALPWNDVLARLESLKRVALTRAQEDMRIVAGLKHQPKDRPQYDEEGLDFTYEPDAK